MTTNDSCVFVLCLFLYRYCSFVMGLGSFYCCIQSSLSPYPARLSSNVNKVCWKHKALIYSKSLITLVCWEWSFIPHLQKLQAHYCLVSVLPLLFKDKDWKTEIFTSWTELWLVRTYVWDHCLAGKWQPDFSLSTDTDSQSSLNLTHLLPPMLNCWDSVLLDLGLAFLMPGSKQSLLSHHAIEQTP